MDEKGKGVKMISAILNICAAIPTIDKWVQQLAVAYFAARISAMKSENIDAYRKVIQDHDQRAMENAIGSPTAGKVSGDGGSVITDGPPPNSMPNT